MMVTKGIILDIDYNSNFCTVRIPILESAGDTQIMSARATFCITPGCYNSYKVDDVVFITFEDNVLTSPIVLGKLYTSAEAEANASGAIACNSLYVNNLTLPLMTNIKSDPTFANMLDGGGSDYSTINDIISKLQLLTSKIEKIEDKIENNNQ